MICNKCGKQYTKNKCYYCAYHTFINNMTEEEYQKYLQHKRFLCKLYRSRNKNRIKEQNKKWRLKNKDKINKHRIEYVIKNRDILKLKKKNYDRNRKIKAMILCGGVKCINCGIDILDVLEFNYIGGGHRKRVVSGELNNGMVLVSDILKGRTDSKLFNIKCSVCNIYDHVERKFGIKYDIKYIARRIDEEATLPRN